ncbi:MAG: 50S ribosomal protein L1, partial [Verrucomicrobiales bacterium]
MSKTRSKRYQKAAALVQEGKAYGLEEAVGTVKSFPVPKFDPTVTVSFHLGVDPRKSDQMVRGSVSLP